MTGSWTSTRGGPPDEGWMTLNVDGSSIRNPDPADTVAENQIEEEMSLASASYLARRAAQKERVRILYRRALKDTLNWAVHRHLFYPDADALREKFEANKHVEDLESIDRLIADAEATYNKWRHPDPYVVPWAPGGSKFHRNPTPPSGIEIIYDYGREETE
ncbi:hypothetical protein M9H77_13597 [Catharanthus roseus]|uniref:Uncharacterized protein n=1 Tax=Catharanthus roseus TaxID=4058 RepID=A0ACC0BKS7_CATRO|nr:hypothetical protein M9H77_13597 [Catharanthus roseus]